MILLGVILLLVGFFAGISLLVILGAVLIIVGAVLNLTGRRVL